MNDTTRAAMIAEAEAVTTGATPAFDAYVSAQIAEILDSIADMCHTADPVHGPLPYTLPGWRELHEYTDANMLILPAMPGEWAMGSAPYARLWDAIESGADAAIRAGEIRRRGVHPVYDLIHRLNRTPAGRAAEDVYINWPGYDDDETAIAQDEDAIVVAGCWVKTDGEGRWWLDYLDHAGCQPAAHDFSWEPGSEHEAHDLNLLLCNDCKAPTFYCDADHNYHHSGPEAAPCFLVSEPGQNVPVPDGFGSGDDWNDHEPCDPATARECGAGQPGSVSLALAYHGEQIAPVLGEMIDRAAGLPARFAASHDGAQITVTDTATGRTATVGLFAYGEVRAALAALFGTGPYMAEVPGCSGVTVKADTGQAGTVWVNRRVTQDTGALAVLPPVVGIPAAMDYIDEGRICPVCQQRIPEEYDDRGERLTNHYADHYTTEHAQEGTQS